MSLQEGDAGHRGGAADGLPDGGRHRGLPLPARLLRAELRAVRRRPLPRRVGQGCNSIEIFNVGCKSETSSGTASELELYKF